MNCTICGQPIDPERLEALPTTTKCTKCATEHPEPNRHDPNIVCAKASSSARNGFAPQD